MPKVCAAVVSYYPTEGLVANVAALAPQVDEVVIVDNASDESSRAHVRTARDCYGAYVIYNDDNLGIAAALNRAANYALERDCEWLATFDQDSLAPADFIASMLSDYGSYPRKERVALIAPLYRDRHSGLLLEDPCQGRSRALEIESAMTSGNLVKTSIFAKVGLFAEDFFIDYVDHEFCLRCNQRGYVILQSCRAALTHSLGKPRDYELLGRSLQATNHGALRRYYNARNRFVLYRLYFRSHPSWVARDMHSFFVESAKIVLLESDKLAKVFSIFKGLWHGLKGNMGRHA